MNIYKCIEKGLNTKLLTTAASKKASGLEWLLLFIWNILLHIFLFQLILLKYFTARLFDFYISKNNLKFLNALQIN